MCLSPGGAGPESLVFGSAARVSHLKRQGAGRECLSVELGCLSL
mgnify:CR=1 FL=1